MDPAITSVIGVDTYKFSLDIPVPSDHLLSVYQHHPFCWLQAPDYTHTIETRRAVSDMA